MHVKDKVSIGAWIYLWAFYFIPLIYISVFVPVLSCLADCGFVVEPEVRQVDSSSSNSSFSRLLWLFEAFCISIQLVKLFILALLGEKVVSLSYSSAILGPPLHYFLDDNERGKRKSWLKNQHSKN